MACTRASGGRRCEERLLLGRSRRSAARRYGRSERRLDRRYTLRLWICSHSRRSKKSSSGRWDGRVAVAVAALSPTSLLPLPPLASAVLLLVPAVPGVMVLLPLLLSLSAVVPS